MYVADQLAIAAKKKGICQEWHDDLLKVTDKRTLIGMYLKGIDFCLANDYPDNDFIRKHFKGVMESYGIYLDDRFAVIGERKTVALGKCKGEVTVEGYKTAEIFVKHESTVTVAVADHGFAVIDVFDTSELHVIASGEAKVVINKYEGAKVEFETTDTARVKIIEKHKKTY